MKAVHDIRTRKMGDMIVADAHIEVDAQLTVEAGHDIAVEARRRVMQRHRVLNLMTHVDPWRRADADHAVKRRRTGGTRPPAPALWLWLQTHVGIGLAGQKPINDLTAFRALALLNGDFQQRLLTRQT